MDAELRQEVEKVIEPYQWLWKEPEFTVETLTVMALTTSCRPLTTREVMIWIAQHFGYYTQLLVDVARDLKGRNEKEKKRLQHLENSINTSFNQLDVPFTESRNQKNVLTYRISTCAARILLKDSVQGKTTTVFPLMNLSPELRNRIYELLLLLPKSGIFWDPCGDQDSRCYTITRDLNMTFEEVMQSGGEGPYYCRPLSQLLAILQVSKQVNREAMPIFFRKNTFGFDDWSEATSILRAVPILRRDHIRQLGINDADITVEVTAKISEILGILKRLRKLVMFIDIYQLIDEEGEMDYRKVVEILDIEKLRKIRGLSRIEFHSDCEELKVFAPMTMDGVKTGGTGSYMLVSLTREPEVGSREEGNKLGRM